MKVLKTHCDQIKVYVINKVYNKITNRVCFVIMVKKNNDKKFVIFSFY